MNPTPAAPGRFDAILFDLDGTLVDSAEDIAASANHVRGQFGLPPLPLEVVRSHVGDGVRMLFERVLETQDGDRVDRAVELWRPHYMAHCVEHTRLYPGIHELLDALAARRIPLAIVTNKPLAPSKTILQGLGIRSLFASVVGGDSTPTRKPDPEPFRLAVREMKIPSSRVLVVGDSPNDVLGARNAGYASCGVLWGIGAEAPLRQSQPDALAVRPEEVLQWVDEGG